LKINKSNPFVLFAIFATIAAPCHAQAPATPAAAPVNSAPQKLNIVVNAVDPGIFHIVAYPIGEPVPPTSPFIVESSPLAGAVTAKKTNGDSVIQISSGFISVHSNGTISLCRPEGLPLLPLCTVTSLNNEVTLTLAHGADERLYGAGNADRNVAGDLTHPSGTQITSNGQTRIPFLWSTGGWSVLVANDVGGTSWADTAGTLGLTVPAPYLDAYLSIGKDGYALLNDYARLTGRAPIPPKWTFGFLMSRWGYGGAADVQDKWHQFRDRQIPIDAFIYDYDWFSNDFYFNPDNFPAGSLDQMKAMGLHFVGIRKPRINGANLDAAKSQGWTLPATFGTDLRFDIPAARYWWWDHQKPLVEAGVGGWWNDEAEQYYDEYFYMTKVEYDGWRAMRNTRAWSINRAFSPGMQRNGAACWTGDIDSNWGVLANQPGIMLNWNMAGLPYEGQDIGGFIGTPTPELYCRWVEEGVFVPVMRCHGGLGSPRWPWAFGDDVLAATTKAIDLRYRLIPYYYTFAAKNAATGAPLMRPLFLEFPNDPATYNMKDEWLMGDRLLAAPILSQGGTRSVYLPAGGWFDFNTNAPVAGGQTLQVQAPLDTIPAYVRAGSIIPLGPVIQSTELGVEDPLEVRIYPGANASFTLYEDDGHTYSYQNGQFSNIPMEWDDQNRTFTVGARTGNFPGMLSVRHLNITVAGGPVKSVTYTGTAQTIRF
jgi:alpha-glucosidase